MDAGNFFILLLTVGLSQAQWDPNFTPGRNTIVHLFEWKWDNIADECERFLGPKGYAGVQVNWLFGFYLRNWFNQS